MSVHITCDACGKSLSCSTADGDSGRPYFYGYKFIMVRNIGYLNDEEIPNTHKNCTQYFCDECANALIEGQRKLKKVLRTEADLRASKNQ